MEYFQKQGAVCDNKELNMDCSHEEAGITSRILPFSFSV